MHCIIPDFSLAESSAGSSVAAAGATSEQICCACGMEKFETIIAFIISANNNEKRIRKIVENICEKCGDALKYNDRVFHAFPTPQQLAEMGEEALREIGAGYRAEYIADTAKLIAEGFDIQAIYEMDYHTAKQELCKLKGIGPKVADCILLFAYKKKNAFPLDVWMKRVLEELYGVNVKNYRQAEEFAERTFGGYAGIAQQYLFHYMRSGKQEKK